MSPHQILQEVDKSKRVLDTQISALSAGNDNSNNSVNSKSAKTSITYAAQTDLPALPIPGLEETLNKFLRNLEALQTEEEHMESKKTVLDFLQNDGPKLQELLVDYDSRKRACGEIGSYVEEFWNGKL